MLTDAVLRAEALSKRYGARTVLDDVSIEVRRGRIHGLLGPNGSGKTTALHIVTGLVRPDRGRVRVLGIDVQDKASREEVGFAPDDLPLPGTLTGREFLLFHDALRRRDDSARAATLTEMLGISGDLDAPVAEYSHGMQRKLQLVAAVMHEPAILILDEPFRGLDPDAALGVRRLLLAYAGGGRAVLVATHDMLRAERDCDEVTILDHGAVVAAGAPGRLISEASSCASLEDVFLRVTGRADDAEVRADRLAAVFR
ncbi:ABC-2 type transport system ATP-binding protein [Microbacterium sp. 8M]|jgi:ABC-2 type transport system ATP-binding protein|uniref:ABC transporter ATP-binding protein n=1 Tax=Microbacterium sp. 8M TaxID=2653153 RepID=UPI0012F0123D|nr:ABC transporter ATP-binding protein [Microbacterium sp. 8M]VXB82927.1 ABC-2 type transport system ATP-binding protein [Microbacterium sp. 8M]